MSGTSGHGKTHGLPSLGQETAPGLSSARSGSGASVEIFAPRGGSESVTSERDLSDLVSRFKSMSTSGSDKLVRPGFGSHGIQTRLRTNFFRLNLTQSVSLFDYILKIEPRIDGDGEDLRKHVIKLFDGSKEMAPFAQGVAHDGVRRLIARAALPQNLHVTVNVPAGDKAYRVTLVGPRELRTTDLSRFLRGDDPEYNPVPIVSAFNLIISDYAARNGTCGSGKRAFYFEPHTETGVRVRADMAVVHGFFMSVRPVYKSLMVNINACMSAFYIPKERLSDAMLNYRRESHGAMHPAKFFGKVRVTTNYLGYPRKSNVKGFGEPARKATFRSEEMGKVTVEKYFQKKYGITLQHADDLPVVILGNNDKDALVPAELCTIEPGSLFTGQLTRRESAALCAANSMSPKGDAQTLAVKGIRLLGFDRKVQPMASFGITVSPELAVVSARILPSPTIVCKSGQLQVSNGSWTTRGFRFANPAGLSKMAVLVLQDGGEDYTSNSEGPLREAIQALLAKCRSCGMEADPSYIVRIIQLPEASPDDPYRDQAVRMIQSSVANFPARPNVVLTFMSNRDTHIFAGLRRVLDTVVGCQGLVALASNIQDKGGQDQYLANLALKLNAKMGGINHLLEPASLKWLQGTMLVGLDLTPPGEGSVKGAPSVAAMTASVNGTFAQYPASLSLQDSKKLAIVNAKNMLIERLKDYRRQNKALPERIIVFRAGLSDGAMQKVAMDDVAEIKKAFRDLADYKPRLTYVVCNKGHKVKFYPMRPEDADPTSNPKAGTVVDQGITGIYEYDFYLQAHSASQGTAKATHYVVVYDENKFSPDTLQHGINDLCYLWAPASASVSLAPPAYWADRACARARLYLHRVMSPIAGSKETKMSERELESRVKGLWGGGIHDDLKGSMYYM